MKKLAKIAVKASIVSLFPILHWYLLSFCLGDRRWINVFTAGYNQQFVWILLYALFIKGTTKWAYKYNKQNEGYIQSSSVVAFLVMLVEVSCMLLNMDWYLGIFNLSGFYSKGLTVYFLYLAIELLYYGLDLNLVYEGKESLALKLSLSVYSIRLIAVFVISRFTHNVDIILALTVGATYVYVFYLYYKYYGANLKKFKLNVFKGFKYEAYNEIGDVAMFIIYFFGLGQLANLSSGAFIAQNMLAVCTDTQWDVLGGAVNDYSSVEILGNKGGFSRKVIINSVILSVCLLLSSVVMLLVSMGFFDFDCKLTFQLFLLECSLFPLYAFRHVVHSWLTLYYHGVWLAVIPLIGYSIRLAITFGMQSVYAISLAVFVVGIVNNVGYILLYYKKRNFGS